jgi:hypothetical protein
MIRHPFLADNNITSKDPKGGYKKRIFGDNIALYYLEESRVCGGIPV